MAKKLTEAQVLKKLNIPDFRHLSKENILTFASMIQDMDPDVAKKALEQFPDFAETSLSVIDDLKETVNKAFEDDKKSAEWCYGLLERIQTTLEKCMDNENLSFEERKYYLDTMMEVYNQASAKDVEGKKFKLAGLAIFGAVGAAAIAAMATLLGGKFNIQFPFKKD